MIDLQLSEKNALKLIPREVVNKFMTSVIQKVAEQCQSESTVTQTSEKTHLGVIYTKESYDVLKKINYKIATDFNAFIEKETGRSAKKYFRNIILFESTSTDNTLQLHWY